MSCPENLGVEVKSCAAIVAGALRPRVFLSLEIQRSNDDLNGREFLDQAKAKKTSACTTMRHSTCEHARMTASPTKINRINYESHKNKSDKL